MFQFKEAYSGFAVNDIAAAKHFYSEVLGLKAHDIEMGLLSLDLGNANVLIYPKDNHVPAEFTILNLKVNDIVESFDALKSEGITFETYEDLGADERGVHHNSGPLIAWFKDPAGNVISLIQE